MAENPMAEFAAIFVEESGGRLTELKGAVEALAGNPALPAECEKARISSHTIRGMAAQMGYEDIAKVSKEVEMLFVELKKSGSAPSPDMVSGARDCAAALEKMFSVLASGTPPGIHPEILASRMQTLSAGIGAAK